MNLIEMFRTKTEEEIAEIITNRLESRYMDSIFNGFDFEYLSGVTYCKHYDFSEAEYGDGCCGDENCPYYKDKKGMMKKFIIKWLNEDINNEHSFELKDLSQEDQNGFEEND